MGEVRDHSLLGSGQVVPRWCLNTEQPPDGLPENKFVLEGAETEEEIHS